jgi:Alkylmercury lyase
MLSPSESTVNVLLSSSAERCTFKIVDGELEEPPKGYFITFSPPPSRWWDDVRFTCSTIQVCESKQVADAWFSKHGFSRGDVLDLETLWNLSKVKHPLVSP